VTADIEGVTGGGLLIYDTQNAQAPVITSGSITGGPMAVSADGSHVYASGSTLFTPPNNSLLDFDITSRSLAQNATFGTANYVALALSKDGSTLYCVDSAGKVDLISTATFQVRGSVAAGVQPSGIAVSSDGTKAVLTDSSSNSVILLDLTHNQVVGTINVGSASSAVAYLN
jgi:DNA-binding beta-propeller fold protein YncE